ncbi:MAG: hypothetical protein GY754_01940 [bacterium]|nr:hypothetical protein [bacterium]
MKIIYATDIHGSFTRVYNLLKETIADVYIISGDLLNMPFYSIEPSIEYYEIQNYFHGLRKQEEEKRKETIILEDFAASLIDSSSSDDTLKRKAEEYLTLTERAKDAMLRKYRVLENIFSSKPYVSIYTIPGNYDMDLSLSALKERNLHLERRDSNGIRFAGYGGAGVRTPGFPEKYGVQYKGKNGDSTTSELYQFMDSNSPDVIAAHHPAQGMLDKLSFDDSWGSPLLRTYCDNHAVRLCLSGHIHEDWGLRYAENTVYLNPSNFGEVMTLSGDISEGGFLHEIEVEGNSVVRVLYRKIVKSRVYDIAEYVNEGETFRENVIDAERLNRHKKSENSDSDIKTYTPVPELRIFRDIRNFFRIHQTEQTEYRVENLEKAIESLDVGPGSVAMDLVGSVNMGIAQNSSDIDLVLYIKGKDFLREGSGVHSLEAAADDDKCIDSKVIHGDIFKEIEDRLREALGEEIHFEVIDCIDLDAVAESISGRNYECEYTQCFAVYRSMCRPVNYKVIAPVEDIMNQDIDFRQQVEENIRTYLRIFARTEDNKKSFDKYQTRLKTLGITLPEYVAKKIEVLLQRNTGKKS